MSTEFDATPSGDVQAEPSLEALYDQLVGAEAETPAPQPEQTQEAEAQPEAQEAAETPEGEQAETPAEQEQEPQDAVPPPQTWTAEMRARFDEMPPDVRRYIAEREAQSHRKISEQGQQLSAFRDIRSTLDQHAATFERHGLSPAQGVEKLLTVQRRLQSEPETVIAELARQYGVSLPQPGDAPNGQQATPEIGDLRRHIATLEQRLSQFTQEQTEAQQTQTRQQVEKFAKDRPYFDEVRPLMAKLVQAGAASDLETAYDMAINADPSVRARIDDDRRREEQRTKALEAANAAKAAKAKARLNVGGEARATAPAPDDYGARYEAAMSRLA